MFVPFPQPATACHVMEVTAFYSINSTGFLLCSSSTRPRDRFPALPLYLTPANNLSTNKTANQRRRVSVPVASLPQPNRGATTTSNDEVEQTAGRVASAIAEVVPSSRDLVILAACVVGLLTGIGVVLFNNAVHEIRDFFWDGIPSRGVSWLREEPFENIWQRVILVPVCGGIIVGFLNSLRSLVSNQMEGSLVFNVKCALEPVLKAVAASVTLGTGNSLGPEGPSVEIGSAIAKGVGNLFKWSGGKKTSLVASGSAAGISSGFNAAVAGCFFAVESVLWPSPADPFSSLTNATSMVILSSVIASVVSEVGLGSNPSFTVPEYDFRSPSELPLYLLLGILCGIVSLALSGCTSLALEFIHSIQRKARVTKAILPAFGGLIVGLIALYYPEILYWGFENVDILLESRPFVNGLPADVLFQLVGVKIIATSLSRASGLVGGYYAPSLFIGAATGVAYGKLVKSALGGPNPLFYLPALEVASPQAYGLVGMAATLAGVCQVPLTSVLLLFELTQDYRIVLPLLGAVGLSSWIASSQIKKKSSEDNEKPKLVSTTTAYPDYDIVARKSGFAQEESDIADICKLESSLCLYDSSTDLTELAKILNVSQAMKTRFVSMPMSTSVAEAVSLMLLEKQSCAVVLDKSDCLLGLVELEDIQNFIKVAAEGGIPTKLDKIPVSQIFHLKGDKHQQCSVTPEMTLLAAQRIMDSLGVNQLPVVSDRVDGPEEKKLVGMLDRECISLACRAVATQELLSASLPAKSSEVVQD